MERTLLSQLLLAYATQPVLLVWIAGIVVALFQLRKARGPALLALCSFSALLLMQVLNTFVYHYALPRFQMESNGPTSKYMLILRGYGVVMAVLYALAAIPLIPAIFGWRSPAQRPSAAARP